MVTKRFFYLYCHLVHKVLVNFHFCLWFSRNKHAKDNPIELLVHENGTDFSK